jgi:hypothetical protein
MNEFPDEQSCKEHFRLQREHEGIKCKKCQSTKQYWLKAKWQWQCAECQFRTSLRSGTTFEHSKLPIRKWYLAMAFMSFSKKGISALELQRQLGHKRYGTVWRMMHTIRTAMGKGDDMYKLEDMVEFDKGYFEKATPENTVLKRGKGSQKQSNVAVMAESTILEDIKTGKQSRHCRYFKMKVLDNHQADAINTTVLGNIKQASCLAIEAKVI